SPFYLVGTGHWCFACVTKSSPTNKTWRTLSKQHSWCLPTRQVQCIMTNPWLPGFTESHVGWQWRLGDATPEGSTTSIKGPSCTLRKILKAVKRKICKLCCTKK